MSLRQKAAKGVLWSLVQKWGRAGISIVVFVALSRMLPPEAFGLVALASAFTFFIELFLDLGFSTAIVQRADLEPEHLDTAFWVGILFGLVMTVATMAASGWIASFFGEPRLAPVLRWLSLGFVISALRSTQTAILQRKFAFKTLAARSMIAQTLGGVLGVAMAFSGYGVWSLVGQDLVSGLVGVAVLWRASNWRPTFRVSRKHYNDLFGFGAFVVGNNALTAVVRRSDDFLIGYYLGPTLLGYYTVGYQLLLVIIKVVTEVTNTVAFPTFSRIQHQPERMRRAFYKVTQYTSLLAFPVFLGLAAVAPDLVPLVFGEQWLPSVPVMQVLSLMGILQSILFFNFSVIRASGKPAWQLRIMLLNAVCSVIGFIIAVRWGIVAVAASFVIVGYLLAPVTYWTVRQLIQIDLRTYLRQFVPSLMASLLMAAVVVGLRYLLGDQAMNPYAKLAIYVASGMLTYAVAIALAAPSIYRQGLELASTVFPMAKLKKTS